MRTIVTLSLTPADLLALDIDECDFDLTFVSNDVREEHAFCRVLPSVGIVRARPGCCSSRVEEYFASGYERDIEALRLFLKH